MKARLIANGVVLVFFMLTCEHENITTYLAPFSSVSIAKFEQVKFPGLQLFK